MSGLLPLVNELRTEVRFVCGIILAVFVQAGRLHSMLALLLRMEHQFTLPTHPPPSGYIRLRICEQSSDQV